MRLFTGLSVPPEARQPLLALMEELQSIELRWSREEKLHITTKFIGEWPEARLAELQAALAGVRVMQPVVICLRGLEWMPDERRPAALVASVDVSHELAHATQAALEPIGIPAERRIYRPHVTLGRVRRKPVPEVQRKLVDRELDVPPFRAAAFHLYLSAGGTYTKLSSYALP